MLFYRCIQFIPDREIPLKYFAQAAAYVREVDEDDTIFVALTEFFGERLWTGDRKLFISLISKGYKNAVEFRDIKLDYPDAV